MTNREAELYYRFGACERVLSLAVIESRFKFCDKSKVILLLTTYVN